MANKKETAEVKNTVSAEKETAQAVETKKTPEQLRSEAEQMCLDYNDAFQAADYAKAVGLRDKIDENVGDYNAAMKKDCYNAIIAAENPMLEAVKTMQYGIIRVKTSKNEEKVPVISIDDTNRYIDLVDLQNRAKSHQRKEHKEVTGIGYESNWEFTLQKMNMVMTIRQAQRIIKSQENLTRVLQEIDSSYAMSDLAKQIELGKTPTSNTQILKTLQRMVTAMVGPDYKVTSHDVHFMCDTYARLDNRAKLKVMCAKHGQFCRIMMNVCNNVVTGDDYDVIYAKSKK